MTLRVDLVGGGRRLLPETGQEPDTPAVLAPAVLAPAVLRLPEQRVFGNGVVLLRYERAAADRTDQ